MNYYNPFFQIPATYQLARPSLFSSLFKNINLTSIISGTQKTLNVVNQAIPIIKQVTPVMQNAKTMFKVMNEFRKTDTNVAATSNNNNTPISNEAINNEISNSEVTSQNEGPQFFV